MKRALRLRGVATVCLLSLGLGLLPLEAQSTPAAPEAAHVMPGDQVAVRIFREPDLGGTFTVSQSGTVVLPRIGPVSVVGRTAEQLQDELRSAYDEYLRNTAVEVVVLRRIAVIGEVRRPDLYMIDLTMSLREVIARAGGPLDTANQNRIVIVRGDEEIVLGREESATFPAARLHSGDQVVMTRRSWYSINALGLVSTAAVVVSVATPIVLTLFRR